MTRSREIRGERGRSGRKRERECTLITATAKQQKPENRVSLIYFQILCTKFYNKAVR